MRVRTSVPDDGNASYTQQRRAAVFRVIDLFSKSLVSFFREHISNLRTQCALQSVLKQPHNVLRDAFADFQRHVPDEPVANDDIHGSTENFSSLDIADKIQRRLFQADVRLACQLITLHFFFADREKRDLRPPRSKNCSVINFSHYSELHEMRRL